MMFFFFFFFLIVFNNVHDEKKKKSDVLSGCRSRRMFCVSNMSLKMSQM